MEYVDHDEFIDPDNLNEYDPESQFSKVLLFSDEEWKKIGKEKPLLVSVYYDIVVTEE